MSRQVNLYEAKTQLSQLVEDAARGEEIIIAKNGKPMAKLVVVTPAEAPKKRALGQWAHLVDPNDKRTDEEWWRDWKAMDAEIERDFERSSGPDLGKYSEWPDTSSTPMSSSGLNEEPHRFAEPPLPKSNKRKTRSS